MNPLEKAARKDPALFAFGTDPLKRLTAEEEIDAPFEARLVSVWAYIVRRARRFTATLSQRERAHLGTDDLVNAIVLSLIEKDRKWDPRRGRYVTFAEAVARTTIVSERERSRVVRAPSNARERLERYRRMDREGTLAPGPRETMHAIEYALGEVEAIQPRTDPATDRAQTPREAAEQEATTTASRDILAVLKSIENPLEALVLARSWGLFGAIPMSAAEIAATLPQGMDARKVRIVKARTEESLPERIRRLRGITNP